MEEAECLVFLIIKSIFIFVSVCNFVSHERCMQFVVSPCISIATSLVRVSAKFVITFAVVILDVNDVVRDGE